MKRITLVLSCLALIAAMPAGASTRSNGWWSRATAEHSLEGDQIQLTAKLSIFGDATCSGFGRHRIGDAKLLFQHFRCRMNGQIFGTAKERAAKKAMEDAKAAYQAGTGSYDAYLEAKQAWAMISSSGVIGVVRFVLDVTGVHSGVVSHVVRIS